MPRRFCRSKLVGWSSGRLLTITPLPTGLPIITYGTLGTARLPSETVRARSGPSRPASGSCRLSVTRTSGVEVVLPVDHLVADHAGADAGAELVAGPDIPAGKIALDIGPATRELFARKLADAKTVFWNGPPGVLEFPAFAAGTRRIVLDLLITLNRREGTTLVLVTHDEQVSEQADRRITLRDGRVVEDA